MRLYFVQLEQREQPAAHHPREVQNQFDHFRRDPRHVKRRRFRFKVKPHLEHFCLLWPIL